MRRAYLAVALCVWLAVAPGLMAQDAQEPEAPAEAVGDAFEPNDDFDQAAPLEWGQTARTSIFPAGDVDFFAFEVPEPGYGYLDVEVREVPEEIALLGQVFGPDRAQLARAQRGFGDLLFLRVLIEGPGQHYVSLRAGAPTRRDRADQMASESLMSMRAVFTPINRAFEPNDTFEEAHPLELGEEVRATLFPARDHDYYKVSVPEPGRGILRAAVSDIANCLRPALWFYDAEQNQIGHFNAGAPGDDIGFAVNIAAPGRYYVLVRNENHRVGGRYRGWSSDASTHPYRLRVDFQAVDDPHEPNDTIETASPIEWGQEVKATIFPAGDIDHYRLAVPPPGLGLLRLTLSDVPENIYPSLRLYDGDGNELQTEQRKLGGEIRMQREMAAPGEYVVMLQDGAHRTGRYWQGWNTSWSAQPYTLKATFAPVVDVHEPNNSHDTAKAIGVNEAVEAYLFPAGDQDFYRFTLPPSARGVLRVRAWGFNDKIVPILRLYNAAKQEIQNVQRDRKQPLTLWREIAEGGDFFLMVQAAAFHDGRSWQGWSTFSSLEPYFLKVEFDPAPASGGEPNDSLDTAEALEEGQRREGTFFPGGDEDFYKFEVEEGDLGLRRVDVDGLPLDVPVALSVFGPDRAALLQMRRDQGRILCHFAPKAAGVHYVSLEIESFRWKGNWVSSQHIPMMQPYGLTVSKVPPIQGDEEPGAPTLAESRPVPSGKSVRGAFGAEGASGWRRVDVPRPGRVELEAFGEEDVDIRIFAFAYSAEDARRLTPKKALYLRGPRRDLMLDWRLADVNLTRIAHNAPEAETALLDPERLATFDAIIVEGLSDPAHFDLSGERAQANILRFVEGGGRFVLLTPFCDTSFLGVENAERNSWKRNASVDLFSASPLLEGVRKGPTRWPNANDAVGHFVNWRENGFEALYGDAADPQERALTVAKPLGKGWMVFDAQPIGHERAYPGSHWKLRAYLGLPIPLETALVHGEGTPTHWRGEGQPERASLTLGEPGVVVARVDAPAGAPAEGKGYSFSAHFEPLPVAGGGERAFDAQPMRFGERSEAESALIVRPGQTEAWRTLETPANAKMTLSLDAVPDLMESEIETFEILAPLDAPQKRVLYLKGSVRGFHLERKMLDVEFETIAWNDERALGVLLDVKNLAGFDAVIAEGVGRPEEFGLSGAAAEQTLEAFAEQGGVVVVMAPLCSLNLFGAENDGAGQWRRNNVSDRYAGHPLLAARREGDAVNGWRGHGSVGWWKWAPGSGYETLFGDWENPVSHAITMAKPVGKGWIVLDAQPVGHEANADSGLWKVYAYLGAEPRLQRIETLQATRQRALGAGEEFFATTAERTLAFRVKDLKGWPSDSLGTLRASLKPVDTPHEPDDSPEQAVRVALGQTHAGNLFPSGDVDWREVEVPGRGVLTVRLLNPPDNIDPVLHVRRKPESAQPTRVLHLEASTDSAIETQRFLHLSVDRISPEDGKAASALDNLQGYDAVILGSLSNARQFGLHRRESHEKLRRYAEAGGLLIVAAPLGVSFAENSPQMGGVLESASSQWDAGRWHAIRASDGHKAPGNPTGGWCSGRGAEFPHVLTWSFGGEARRLNRLVLFNHSRSDGAQAKSIEVSVSDDGENFRTVGRFEAAQSDLPQEFAFETVACKQIRLAILSNHGHASETQVGQAEFYGPDSIRGFFGLTTTGTPHSGGGHMVDPEHWTLRRRETGAAEGWPHQDNAGWWTGWQGKGWRLVLCHRDHPTERALTLAKPLGRGWVVLDAQRFLHRANAERADWKLANYLDAARPESDDFNATQRLDVGGDETVDMIVEERGIYQIRISDNPATGNYLAQSPLFYEFSATFQPEGSEFEPNDSPTQAKLLPFGQPAHESLFPADDEDWFKLAVDHAGVLDVTVDQVPSNVAPVMELHRRPDAGKTVRALHLACRGSAADLSRRLPGSGVEWTRVEADAPEAAGAMDRLADFDVVLLDGLHKAGLFGMDNPETWRKIETYAEGGGRFVAVAPFQYSFNLVHPRMGGQLVGFSSQWNSTHWSALNVFDGTWAAGNSGKGWCASRGASPPHWFVFGFEDAKPRRVDRVVVYNTSRNDEARSKEIEVLVGERNEEDAFQSVGKFTLEQADHAQEFRFEALQAHFIKFVIHSNYGHAHETQLGQVEFYGPDAPHGLFGLRHWMQQIGRSGVEAADAGHWIVSSQAEGRADNWPGRTSAGWFSNGPEMGFDVVHSLSDAPQGRAVTLCKPIGKGFLVVEAQNVTEPGRDENTDWKLANLLGVQTTFVSRHSHPNRRAWGEEVRFRAHVQPGVYWLRLANSEPWRWALDKMRITAELAPAHSPFEPNDAPESAAWLPSGAFLANQSYPIGDVDWFRMSAADATVLRFEMTEVPDDIEPLVEVFRADDLDRPLGRFSRTTGGDMGWPQAFSLALPEKGEYLARITAPNRASLRRYRIRAVYDDEPPPSAPRVMSVSPPDGFADAAARPTVVVNFDRPLDPSTVNERTVALRGAMSGAVPVSVSYDPEASQAVVEALRDFAPGETVSLAVSGDIADPQGRQLAAETRTMVAVAAPEAREAYIRVALDPPPPLRAGTVRATLTSTVPLRDVQWSWAPGGAAARPVENVRQEAPGRWTATLRIAQDTPNGAAAFLLAALDAEGAPVPDIAEGKTFEIDTVPPPAPPTLSATAAPGGAARVVWARPEAVTDVAGYRLYRAERDADRREGMELARELAGADATAVEDVPPADGTYFYRVSAVDRAGNESQLSPSARVETDRDPPAQPVAGVEAVVEEKPRIDVSWQAVDEAGVVGYSVFRFKKGEEPPPLAQARALTETPLERVAIQDFPGHGQYVYFVAARDGAGNLGPAGSSAVVLDLHPPVARIEYSSPPPFTPGEYVATITLDEPLKEPLRISVRFADGSVRKLEAVAKDELTYETTLVFGEDDPEGTVTMQPEGEDLYGNEGIRVVHGRRFHLDTEPPKAWISMQPSGRVKAGTIRVRVDFNENVQDGPKLFWSVGDLRREVALEKVNNRRYRGEFEIPPDAPNGQARFEVVAEDMFGHVGGEVLRGGLFTVDTEPPEPPFGLVVRPGPDQKLWVHWNPHPKEPAAFYRLYGARAPEAPPGEADLLADNVRDTKALFAPEDEEPVWLAVTAVDLAGNESALSRPVMAEPDLTPPPPPERVETTVMADGRVRVSWPASETDEAVRYRLYRAREAIESVEGMRPLAETRETFAVDAPPEDAVFYYAVAAVDDAGNVAPLASAEPLDYDTGPPTARVEVSPLSGQKRYSDRRYQWRDIGVLNAGEKAVSLVPNEPLIRPPVLRYRANGMEAPREIPLAEGQGAWTGRLVIPEKEYDGLLTFFFEGEDLKGNQGQVVRRGEGDVFWVDTQPPEAVAGLAARSEPFGRVALEWGPPPGEDPRETTYAVYRAEQPLDSVEGLAPVASGLTQPRYTDDPLKDGAYYYLVVAVDVAGHVGKASASVRAVSDSAPPKPPTDVAATVKGRVLLTWKPGDEQEATFRVLRNGQVVAEGLKEAAFADLPPEDGAVEYAVVAVDKAGNTSDPSAPLALDFTNTLPVASISTEPPSPMRSTFRVTVQSSQPLKEAPEVFLHFRRGRPERVGLLPADGTGQAWTGSVRVDGETPNGEARFTFRGVAEDGGVGERIAQGETVAIDTRPPSASVSISPSSPVRAGDVSVFLRPSEPLAEVPSLNYTTMGAPARPVALQAERDGYAGEIVITGDDQDGVAFFSFSGTDLAGNTGTALSGERFVVDNHPPKPPVLTGAVPQRHGLVELAWDAPLYRADEKPANIAGYIIYAAPAGPDAERAMRPVARSNRLRERVTTERDGEWVFAITTASRSGLESERSNALAATSKRQPPKPPTLTQAEARRADIAVAWEAGEDAARFDVFVHYPGEDRPRKVAEKIEGREFAVKPLLTGLYAVTVAAWDELGHRSAESEPARVAFEQNTPLASIKPPAPALGPGTHRIALQTTRPLIRPPQLRLEVAGGPVVDVPMQGEGDDWSGELALGQNLEGESGRFLYEGVALVEGEETAGDGVLSGETVILDFVPPTAAVEFSEALPMIDRKPLLKAGVYQFALRSSEPLQSDPVLTFTPRGKPSSRILLTKIGETVWSGALRIDEETGDGTAIFEFEGVDLCGNRGLGLTLNRNVEVSTRLPAKIGTVRAMPLPGGKARVEWTPPFGPDGQPDADANTFYIYRSGSEIADAAGLQPHRILERSLGFVERLDAERYYYYAVAAVDRAGNVGPISDSASVLPELTPPNPPKDLRAHQLDTGVVHLTWEAPDGKRPVFYNVYLESHPILTTQGLTPRNRYVTWTEIYGSPREDGRYYFAVTSVDEALNESGPSNVVMMDYHSIPPFARFYLEPDIWLKDGDYPVLLETTKPLAAPPKVEINSESGQRYPLAFEGEGSRWTATLTIGPDHPEGTYGFLWQGRDEQGTPGDEIERGPLFHVDRTPPLPPGNLRVEADARGTPGAVVLTWNTPKKEDEATEVPHFYNIYRAQAPILSVEGMAPVQTFEVVYENLDEYMHRDMPPANGVYHYVVTSLDLARNESAPSNDFRVEVHSDSPRASIELFALDEDGQAWPAPTDGRGVPLAGKGRMRVEVKTAPALAAPPILAWRLRREEGEGRPVPMSGEGDSWRGEFAVEDDYDDSVRAEFSFGGVSPAGTSGTFIRRGREFRIETRGPVAEIVIPSVYKMQVEVKSNTLVVPPVKSGLVAVELTADKELGRPPALTYTLNGGAPVPVPMTGFGRNWRGWMDIPDVGTAEGRFQYEGVDRAGNVSVEIAPRRYPYDVDDKDPPRKIANYATTGGEFTVDTVPPGAPWDVETEMRRLGVAVVKWKEPEGDPATYSLYRSLTPILSVRGMKPLKTGIFATVIVDDPPVDGNYFYAVTAVDMAGNESELSECRNVFIDTIKPELKIQAVPSGEDFVILLDEDAPAELSLTINFPGGQRTVQLGGSSGELQEFRQSRLPDGRRGVVLPQQAAFFDGRVEVIVHSPDPEGNVVETITEVEMRKISQATGGEVSSTDDLATLVIPPGLQPVIPLGPKEARHIPGYDNLFFIRYANIPSETPELDEEQPRNRDQVDPLPPGLEVVGRPYVIEMNAPPQEPLQLRASATQADLSQLQQFTAKLKMSIPEQFSDAVQDPEYLKKRLKVVKWVPTLADDEPGRWEFVPDIELDPETSEIIVPANDITTYVIVSERTPPSIREQQPEPDGVVAVFRPVISCLIVDKGTGVAVGAENRIVLTLNGERIEEKYLEISAGDPTEVRVSYTPPEDLAPGLHTVGIRAEDVVENVANVRWRFTVDNQPPEIGRVWPEPGTTLAVARPVIKALVRDEGGVAADGVRLSIAGRAATRYRAWSDPETGVVSVALEEDLETGEHEVELTVADKGGLESSRSWKFVVDLEPPSLANLSPPPGGQAAPGAPATFQVLDRHSEARVLEVRLDGRRLEEGQDGYRFDPRTATAEIAPQNLPFGERRVNVVVADALGNAAEREWSFAVASGAPPAQPAPPKPTTEPPGPVATDPPPAAPQPPDEAVQPPPSPVAQPDPQPQPEAKPSPIGKIVVLVLVGAGLAAGGVLAVKRKR